jgi:hypothetical protein
MSMSSYTNGGLLGTVLLEGLTVRNLVFVLIAYASFKVISQIVYYRFFSPIKDFPGPFWASVTRLWIAWHNVKATEIETAQALHKKYGRMIKSMS